MRRLLLALCVMLALGGLDPAAAQRGPGRRPAPHEIKPTIERAREQGIAAQRSFNREQARQTLARLGSLSPTRENFERSQTALAILSAGEPAAGPPTIQTTSSLVSRRDGLNYFAELAWADASGVAFAALLRGQVAVVDAIPEDPLQFRDRFGRPMSARDQGDVARFKQQLRSSTALQSRSFQAAMNGPSRFVLIVAHNENGRIVDGTGRSIGLGEAANSCRAGGHFCIFIVCNSQTAVSGAAVGMVRRVNIVAATELVRDLSDIVASAEIDSAGNMRLPIRTAYHLLERLDREGGLVRIVGYRVAEWFVVHTIMVVPNCRRSGDC